MQTFNIIAGVVSIIGMLFSLIAAIQAGRASKAAAAARDAAFVRSLADELLHACSYCEQLVDFLHHSRYSEARLRIDELTWLLSEIPHRRGAQLSTSHQNALLNSRQQLQSVNEAITNSGTNQTSIDKGQVMKVARRVTMKLRELLGDIRSIIESGEPL